ncbi:transcriptional regulator [Fusibacter paucivorans]|uniref:Transcriptional regulator n=1 Tax=Fusibacter paucivorans TaxID=76009 RepID=A0ABS5PLA5_9FIRM|nr:transcriptional regulator [Fusibacter paucivorans]MBS7525169.1 transcriptional regulator [Fusibacter paucivorans]
MGALTKALKLLDILQDSDYVYSSTELSKALNISERQVRSYIKELRDYGIDIQSEKSWGGGYLCRETYIRIPNIVTNEEMKAMTMAKRYFDDNLVLENKAHFDTLFYKIRKRNRLFLSDPNRIKFKSQFPNAQKTKEQLYQPIILSAIDDCHKVEMVYFSNKSRQNQIRVVHPYALTFYKDAFYIHGYCEKASDYRTFKMIRIQGLKPLSDMFKRQKSIEQKIEDGAETQGLYCEDVFRLKAYFHYPFNAYVQEIEIGKEQHCEVIDDEVVYVEATLNNWTETISWLHNFSYYCEVIEPVEMRLAMIEDIQKNLDIYNQ